MDAIIHRLRSGTQSAPSPSSVPVLLRLPHPSSSLVSLQVPFNWTHADLLSCCASAFGADPRSLRLSSASRSSSSSSSSSSDAPSACSTTLSGPEGRCHPAVLSLLPRLRGGKGGFGSMLRAAGGKMSSKRGKGGEEDTSSCRDLNGRRLGVMKEAQKLAEYLAAEPARRKALDEKMQKKYARLEKMLGRRPQGREDLEEAARKMGEDEEEMKDAVEFDEESDEEEANAPPAPAAAGSSSKTQHKTLPNERFDDHQYLEESREIVSNARSAVAAAMKKKKLAAAKKKAAAVSS